VTTQLQLVAMMMMMMMMIIIIIIIILLFHGRSSYANAPECCVTRTLPCMALAAGSNKILDFLKQHFEISLCGVDRQVKKPMAIRLSWLYTICDGH